MFTHKDFSQTYRHKHIFFGKIDLKTTNYGAGASNNINFDY